MGNYRVIYLEDLGSAEVFVECPVCKEIENKEIYNLEDLEDSDLEFKVNEKNIIEPVALVVKEEDFDEEEIEKIKINFKSIEDIKNSNYIDKILNKNDLVCIFHQKKENFYWNEDIKEFKYKEKYENKNIYNGNNLVFKFWQRLRAYRFAVDYIYLWKKQKNWKNFIRALNKDSFNKISNLYKKLILFYFKNLKSYSNCYCFQGYIFPNFYEHILGVYTTRPIAKNFWYENEELKFRHIANFSYAKFLENIYFDRVEIKENVYFYKSSFKGKFSLFESEIRSNIYFYKSGLERNFISISSHINKLIFKKVKIANYLILEDSIINTIILDLSFFYKINKNKSNSFLSIKIRHSIIKQYISIKGSKIKINCYLSDSFINKVSIKNIDIRKNFILERNYISKLSLRNFDIPEDINFKIYDNKVSSLYTQNLINYSKSFTISNMELLSLKRNLTFFEKFLENEIEKIKQEENFGNIIYKILSELEYKLKTIKKLKNIHKITKIEISIKNSLLTNTKFINCDFSQAEEINIRDSYLEETIFANVNWGEISEKRICPELFEKEPDKARDIYRQIKLSLDKQADYINANWFYALEMKAYEKYLQSKSWFENFQEKAIFTLHKFISNFGLSWTRPLVLIISSTIVMLGFGLSLNNKPCTSIFSKGIFLSNQNLNCVIPLFGLDFWLGLSILYLMYISFVSLIKVFKNININIKKASTIFIYLIPLYIALYLILGISLKEKNIFKAFFEFWDNFFITLNISNIFVSFVKNDSGYTNFLKLYSGHLALYKLYAIFILVLIYQLIVAIRRRVRR